MPANWIDAQLGIKGATLPIYAAAISLQFLSLLLHPTKQCPTPKSQTLQTNHSIMLLQVEEYVVSFPSPPNAEAH
jgi:hypothetical protein